MDRYSKFARIAEIEFSKIVSGVEDYEHKLRVYLADRSFIDLFISRKSEYSRFSIHWERRHLDNTLYRVDNAPDIKWEKVKTYPTHFHKVENKKVVEPPFTVVNVKLEDLFRSFLTFVRDELS